MRPEQSLLLRSKQLIRCFNLLPCCDSELCWMAETKADWKFAKSLSEITVTQKFFEQRQGQWESERGTERDSRPQQDRNHANVGGLYAPVKRQQKDRWRAMGVIISINSKSRCSGGEISHSFSPPPLVTNPSLTADAWDGLGVVTAEPESEREWRMEGWRWGRNRKRRRNW